MVIDIRYQEVKVRRPNPHLYKGEDKYTGTVTYSVVGTVNRERVRMALGTEEKKVAIRRVGKLEQACAEGANSALWHELEDSLPYKTFKWFADRAGFVATPKTATTTARPTWQMLCDIFEAEMQRLIDNKARGASSEEGTMSPTTRDRYRQSVRHFAAFLGDPSTTLEDIKPSTIELFKLDRRKKISVLKQSRGGTSIALDIAILHRMFALAVKKGLMLQKPIDLQNESKPGKNPKNGARPFTAEELGKLRKVADDDLFMFLLLRWTGLRGSDTVSLRWSNVHFDRGVNGEIEVLTQKRTKVAIVPLSTELRNALEDLHRVRKPKSDEQILWNPETGKPFTSRARMYERVRKMGLRAGIGRATPHFLRDTFACDMLARGAAIYDVAKMLADTVDTIEKHYAQFVPAARDAAQSLMDRGVGIEERAKLVKQRGRKVVGIR